MAEFHNLSNAREVEMALHTGDMTEMLLALQGSVHFVIKRLRMSQVPEHTLSQSCRLMVPSWFVRKHGDKFHQTVVLRTGISTRPCRVRLSVVYTPARIPEIKLGRGWREFATYNELVVGDSLIFELRAISEFKVHIFRGNEKPNAEVSSSHDSEKCCIDSELSQENGKDDSCAAYSSHQHLVADRSAGSPDGVRAWISKREIGEEGVVSSSPSTFQNSSCINVHQVSQLENVQMSSFEKRRDSQKGQEPQAIDHQKLKMPGFSGRDDCAQVTDARKAHDKEFQQPTKASLPSFIQRLVLYNVQDAVGNTCGAFFEVPYGFAMTHGIQLQAAHVQLQGILEESPIRPVTACFHSMQKDGELSTRPLLRLGWGDFVRENALRAGQELVFTLAAESFFAVREVSEIVI